MLTIAQCRGARGLLGWTQQDLADASGLSKTAINNFEKGHSDIKTESLKAVRMAFESADIEFLAHNGIRQKSETLHLFKGHAALDDLFHDITESFKHGGGELMISHIDSGILHYMSTERFTPHLARFKKQGIRQRILGTEEPGNILGPQDQCRLLPRDVQDTGITTFIYAGKLACSLWGHTVIFLVNSPEAIKAETQRFEKLWAKATRSDTLLKKGDNTQNQTA